MLLIKALKNLILMEKFDLIFSINVLEHVQDYKKYIENTSKFLNKNGANIIL